MNPVLDRNRPGRNPAGTRAPAVPCTATRAIPCTATRAAGPVLATRVHATARKA